MKKILLIVLFIFVTFSSLYYFLVYLKQNKETFSNFSYNPINNEWEKTTKNPPTTREELKKIENTDGTQNRTILRGYYDSYDEEKNLLKIKSLVPFTFGEQYEQVSLKLSPNQTASCIPSQIIDPNTQKAYPIWKLTFPVMDGEDLKIDLEKPFEFEKLLSEGSQGTYLFIQLTKNFNEKEDNYIKKLIVAGLCD